MTTPQVAIAAKACRTVVNEALKKIKVKVKLNGQDAELSQGHVVDSLLDFGLNIPTVCYHPDVCGSGGRCRVCCCNVNGRIMPTCDIEIKEGMNIITDTPELERLRDAALQLVPHDDAAQIRIEEAAQIQPSQQQKTQQGQEEEDEDNEDENERKGEEGKGIKKQSPDSIPLRKTSKYILRHPSKCTHCGLCTIVCAETQGVGAIADVRFPSGEGSIVESFHNANLADTECISCGQCVAHCPTGALEEASEIDMVEHYFNDPEVIKVVQFAPAVRVALAEEFGFAPGQRLLTKEMVEAARILSNRKSIYVFDTNFTADLTIIEEGYELLERLRRTLTGEKKFGGAHMNTQLPMITSCSPGWVLFAEKNYHDLLPNLSSCKSPQQMFGALVKHHWGPKIHEQEMARNPNQKKRRIVSISVMPCVAKKAEKERPEFATNGEFDVDHVITTREFARMCREKGVDPTRLKGEDFDTFYGTATGAGAIFGATSGVMEAALRTAYEVVTGREVPFRRLDIIPIRGFEGVKEAKIKLENVLEEWKFLEGVELSVAITHGLANARKLMDRVRAAHEQGLPPPWHFIEVMACPGGCIGGGGQPKPSSLATKMERAKLIYEVDRDLPMRKSHSNPAIQELYKTFLKEPLGEMSHHLLHTEYTPRESEACSLISSPEAKEIRQKILYAKNYPINTRHGLTNILADVVDEYGYISDYAVAAIASHVGATPVAIDSVISHYHFFHRKKPTSKSTLYLCDCLTCRSKGSREIKHAIRQREHNDSCITCENKMEVHMIQWLGFCMNGAPTAMVKRAGDPRLHALYDLKIDDARIASQANLDAVDNPQEGIRFRQFAISRLKLDAPTSERPSILDNIRLTKEETDYRLSSGGRCPISRKICKMAPEQILEEIKISGVRGCGGAGFPTWMKWKSVRDAPADKERYVVINCDEGLPSTFKDYAIIADPSRRMRMIIGMCLCAKFIGAKKCVMYLRYEYKNFKKPLEDAFHKYVTELSDPEQNLGDGRLSFEIVLAGGPYVAGEETALFESVEGHAPQARCHREKYATEVGLHNCPTVVNNVETLAWIPAILHSGGKAFSDLGINNHGEDDKHKNSGIKLFCISGQVAQPTLAEYPMGTTLRQMIQECAPEIPLSCSEGDSDLCGDLAAVEVGGAVEWLLEGDDLKAALDMPLSLAGAPNSLPGGGSIVLFRRSFGFNAADVYQSKAKFAHVESCNLCAPCREGTRILRGEIRRIITNPRAIWEKEKREMARDFEMMRVLSNCGHGKAVGAMARKLFEKHVLGPGVSIENAALPKGAEKMKLKLWEKK